MKKQKKESKPKKDVPKKAEAKKKYFYCDAKGHWRRNCPLYLKSLKTKKGDKSSEGMLVIESNLMISSTSNWVLDSGSSAHICTSMQDLIENRRLRKSDMILRIGNRAKVAVEAVGTYPLRLPFDFRLDLKHYYFIPIASQNLIFVSVLVQEGFKIYFNKDFCFIYLRNKFVSRDLLINSLYHLHVDANVNLNEQIMNAVG